MNHVKDWPKVLAQAYFYPNIMNIEYVCDQPLNMLNNIPFVYSCYYHDSSMLFFFRDLYSSSHKD